MGFLYVKWPCGCYLLGGEWYWCLRHISKHKRLTVKDWDLVLDDWTKNRYFEDPREPMDHSHVRVLSRARASARCESRGRLISVQAGTPLPGGLNRYTLYCQYCYNFDVVDARNKDEAERLHRDEKHRPIVMKRSC